MPPILFRDWTVNGVYRYVLVALHMELWIEIVNAWIYFYFFPKKKKKKIIGVCRR